MFKWKKKGLIWAPSSENKWAQEYGQNPNAVVLPDRIRIYFSSRKKSESFGGYISYVFFVDVDKDDPTKVIATHLEPILNPSDEREFDEFGTMPGSIIMREDREEVWLYYVGWSRSNSIPYKWANGIAISKDGGCSFQKMAKRPIVSATYAYPFLQACPRVFKFEQDCWLMWYAAGIEWYEHEGKKHPIYMLRSAQSPDGIHWDLSEESLLPTVFNKECQSSASVIRLDGLYHMFFSYRDVVSTQDTDKQYRIGYASSKDLITWQRDDTKAGITVSNSGWDADAVCYPHVVTVNNKILMFYSGNQYGCAGFGYAELER